MREGREWEFFDNEFFFRHFFGVRSRQEEPKFRAVYFVGKMGMGKSTIRKTTVRDLVLEVFSEPESGVHTRVVAVGGTVHQARNLYSWMVESALSAGLAVNDVGTALRIGDISGRVTAAPVQAMIALWGSTSLVLGARHELRRVLQVMNNMTDYGVVVVFAQATRFVRNISSFFVFFDDVLGTMGVLRQGDSLPRRVVW